VAKFGAYRPVFSEGAADFLLQLPKSRQRKVIALARQLAEHPVMLSDYRLTDETGREIEHLLIDDYVFAYWVDHGEREVRLTDIEDAS
jgi:mRNA-degrading endonuclease RelE of RelBE toxin-antitoxin system